MVARIFRPAKPAASSGRFRSAFWVLEVEPNERAEPDPLMGWLGSRDTEKQVRLRFPTKHAAVAYAEREGIAYRVQDPQDRVVKPKAYADNFTRKV